MFRFLHRPSSFTSSFATFRLQRHFATHTPTTTHPTKPKPKAATPLRRSAAASRPIRENTERTIQSVFTLTTAEAFDLRKLRSDSGYLPPGSIKLYEAWYIPRWLGESQHDARVGEVFIFANGSIVSWGLTEEDTRKFSVEVIASSPGVEVAPLAEAETEELEFISDPTEHTRLQGDLIILGGNPDASSSATESSTSSPFPPSTLLARYTVSQALSRSTALSAIEESLDRYLSTVALLPHALYTTGKPGLLGRTELIKKLGQLMKFRQVLNLSRENFSDTPDFYWGRAELEALFNSISDALEVKARTTAVNEKITYAVEAQSVLRQLLTESSSHSMELVIILLIAVEVVIALIRDGPELWHMLFGPPPTEAHSRSDAGAVS